MMETYIFVTKEAAPAGTQSDLQGAKAERRGTYTVRHMLPRVNCGGIFGGIFGGILGALAAAAIWVPVAYLTRGYWAVGGEIFLIGLAAGLGSWLGGDQRG